MKNSIQNINNKIFFNKDWGYYIGEPNDNLFHKHYAVQLSISIKNKLVFSNSNNEKIEFDNILIKSNVTHKMDNNETILVLLFHPSSKIGHYYNHLLKNEIDSFSNRTTTLLKQSVIPFIQGNIDFNELSIEIDKIIKKSSAENDEIIKIDKRIAFAIEYLEINYSEIIPASNLAQKCNISESRFLHLFKENAGITYRKFQQWNKVKQSISVILKQNLTQTAAEMGFADSAHFTNIFKETFGFSPKNIKNK